MAILSSSERSCNGTVHFGSYVILCLSKSLRQNTLQTDFTAPEDVKNYHFKLPFIPFNK